MSYEKVVTPTDRSSRADIAQSIDRVRSALESLQFGAITLTVHDGRVVQLDITEKRRFAS